MNGAPKPPSRGNTADDEEKRLSEFRRKRMIEQRALPVLHKSPSWPTMNMQFDDQLRKVQRPQKMRKAICVALLIILNDVLIFVAAAWSVTAYLGVGTTRSWGSGFEVQGAMLADVVQVDVDGEQQSSFTSSSAGSALLIGADTGKKAKVVLRSGPTGAASSFEVAVGRPKPGEDADQFVVRKGSTEFWRIDGGKETTYMASHLDLSSNSVIGHPLLLSTGAKLADSLFSTNATNTTASTNLYNVGDVLITPSAGASVKVNAPLRPLSGDLVLQPLKRLVVEKLSGPVGTLRLSNTLIEIANTKGKSNQIATDEGNGDLSIAGTIIVQNHANRTTTLNGPLDLRDNALRGSPLSLTSYGGSDITISASASKRVVITSPLVLSGPIVPSASAGLALAGTLKVSNLQFEMLKVEENRVVKSPSPNLECTSGGGGKDDMRGMLRMTKDQLGREHIFFCTGNGWLEFKTQ